MDPEIKLEQEHLLSSREALARMRARTSQMSALGGDRVSSEYLKSTLFRRMKALEDDPEIPLFFGRLDYGERSDPADQQVGLPGERFYVGRRHVTDEVGDPMVVDWRAPISRPFYRASRGQRLGVARRRRFGFQHGVVTAYEDETLTSTVDVPAHSEILEAEIERPRIGPMRDIVATIQPEQDEIVRGDLAATVCVQGAPGTGKTAVGLHRAAYLLYAHRDQLSRQGVLVVGPNESFLRYISDVLPALGEIDARQTTIGELVAHAPIRASDDAAVALLKGDERMAKVMRKALWNRLRPATDPLVVPMGARRWRIPAYEADNIVAELCERGVRYGAGRAMLPQRLAHQVLVKMEIAGDSPDDRVQSAVSRTRGVKSYVDRLWPQVDPVRLVMDLLGDRDALASAADGTLTGDEQELISWSRTPRGPGSARWTLHDLVLIDEAADLLERTPSLGHVVLDEAQDLSPMMLRAVGRQCSTGSATVLGDIAQATTPWGVSGWEDALGHLGKPASHVEELTLGFRVPGEVIDYAARLLPVIAPSLKPPTSVRRSRGELVIDARSDADTGFVDHVREALERLGSVGVIVADPQVDPAAAVLVAAAIPHAVLGRADEFAFDADEAPRVDVVPASLSKGLEFDHVVLLEPATIADTEADAVTGLRRLYVCLTRAVTSLAVVHARPIPAPLSDA